MTTDERWLRIKELFALYQQQPDAGRDAWLQQQCGDDGALLAEVRTLLAAQHAAADILVGGAAGVLRNLGAAEAPIDRVGQSIDAYRLLRLVGEGGMGSVYLAEREGGDFAQRVALKLVRADFISDETRARFSRERNFLARLIHPHIAQLHDGGVAADGTPFFTLEYVEGEPIARYCDAHTLGIRQRVVLMLQVCAAVAYAHRNLIVHRDLKPSNILITADGEAKLLDFGIAKLLDAEPGDGQTATQARMMTPEYAAPEQVLGEPITTATDVYAIGVLLYELLCGRLPYARADAGSISWSKAVVEEAPESLGRALSRDAGATNRPTGEAVAATRGTTLPTLRRSLRGDLDRIVARSLAKEPESRYPSVSALADDLRAFAEGRAISGGSRRYRLRKFVRRHWLPLAAATTIVLILVASTAAIVWQARQTEHEARTTLAVKDFLFGLFTAVDPHVAKGRTVSANELLDRGAERIERNKALDAEQKAEIEGTLGRIYFQLGLFDSANKLQESAIKALAANPGQALLYARTEAERADTLDELGDLKSAETMAADARQRIYALPNAAIADRLEVVHVQSRAALMQRNFAQAQHFAEEELPLARQVADTDTGPLVRALMASGGASWGLAQTDQAESIWREALAVALRSATPEDIEVAQVRGNLANALMVKSHYAEAVPLQEQALAAEEKALGADHPLTMGLRRDLALSNYRLGYYAQARAMMEQVIAAQRKKLGDQHPAVAGSEINLGSLLVDSGDADAAERVLGESAAIFDKKYGREYQGTRMALRTLAAAHAQQGKLDLAEKELNEIRLQEDKLDLRAKEGDETDINLGDVKRLRGDAKTAIELNREALAISIKRNTDNSRYAADAHQHLAMALRDSGDDAGAEREFRASLVSRASYLPNADDPTGATTRYDLAVLLLKRQKRDEGARLLTEAVQLREKFLGADDAKTKQAREALLKAQAAAKLSSPRSSAASG